MNARRMCLGAWMTAPVVVLAGCSVTKPATRIYQSNDSAPIALTSADASQWGFDRQRSIVSLGALGFEKQPAAVQAQAGAYRLGAGDALAQQVFSAYALHVRAGQLRRPRFNDEPLESEQVIVSGESLGE